MDNSSHQETLTKAIKLLGSEIERHLEIIGALTDAQEVLKIYSTELAFPGYNEYNFLTRAQVTKYLGVAHTSIHRYIAGKVPRGKPPFPQPTAKVGHKQLYKREEIVAWKNALNFTPTDA